ncbi:Arm DNA-binding domain-containing protein [Enterobacter cloacae]
MNDGIGLSLLIDTSGSKGWRYRYRFAGKPKMISFSVYGDVSLAQASAKRDKARSMLAKEVNPSEAR